MKPISRFNVLHSYNTTMRGEVVLPDGKTTEDISYCYIKWGRFFCGFKDGTEIEVDIYDDNAEVQCKRPNTVAIIECDSEGNDIGNIDYAEVLGL